MRITANHAHIFPGARRADGTVDELLKMMDACGIDECAAFATFHSFFDRYTDSPNQYLADAIKPHDRLYGFGVIDFDSADIRGQVRQIKDLGLRGIKLHPAFQRFHVMGEKACQVYEEAQEAGLFLSFHTGVHWDRIANYQPMLFDEVAYHYPRLRFSMEHIGGYSFFREALAVLTNNCRDKEDIRVFGGLTSVFDREVNALWHLTSEEIEEAVLQAGENAFIFGLDFPYNNVARAQQGIDCILALNISDQAKQKLLGGNLRRVLGIA